jgi:hypothetical protein
MKPSVTRRETIFPSDTNPHLREKAAKKLNMEILLNPGSGEVSPGKEVQVITHLQ